MKPPTTKPPPDNQLTNQQQLVTSQPLKDSIKQQNNSEEPKAPVLPELEVGDPFAAQPQQQETQDDDDPNRQSFSTLLKKCSKSFGNKMNISQVGQNGMVYLTRERLF